MNRPDCALPLAGGGGSYGYNSHGYNAAPAGGKHGPLSHRQTIRRDVFGATIPGSGPGSGELSCRTRPDDT